MQGLDIETAGPDGRGSLDPAAGRIRLVQIRDAAGVRIYGVEHVDPSLAIRRLDAPVAHNAVFEAAWIGKHLGIKLINPHDTMIISQVLYTGTNAAKRKQFSHSLQAVVKRELKKEMSKDEQDSEWGAPELTLEQLHYAAYDALVMPELADKLLPRLARAGLLDVYTLEVRVSHAVDAMQRNGFAVNAAKLDPLVDEVTERAETLKAELEAEWGINPGSGKQLIEYFRLEGRNGWPKTKGGKPKTDQEAMKRPIDEEPSVKKWIECKEVEKIHSRYGTSILAKLDEDGRLRARFNAFGTATERFSCRGLGYAVCRLCT